MCICCFPNRESIKFELGNNSSLKKAIPDETTFDLVIERTAAVFAKMEVDPRDICQKFLDKEICCPGQTTVMDALYNAIVACHETRNLQPISESGA